MVNSLRLKQLDGLRGIAVMMVLMSHYTWAFDFHFNTMDEHYFHFPHGESGVQLFFMISGYVIFMTISRTQNIMSFIISRFSRLYPVYWFSILLTVLITLLFPIPTLGDYSAKQILLNLTMVQGFIKIPHVDQVYWSLGIELIFYALIGILFQLRTLNKIVWICMIWLLAITALLTFQIPLERFFNFILIGNYAPLFVTGILFYQLKNSSKNQSCIVLLIISALILSEFQLYFALIERAQYELSITPFIILFVTYFVFYLAISEKLPLLERRLFQFLGKISYPLYLLHNVIGYIIIYHLRFITNNQFFYVLITTLIIVFISWLVSRFIETPANAYFRNKLNKIIPFK